LKSDILINAGICLSVSGRAKPGESVAEITVDRLRGADDSTPDESYTIRYGTITVIPLAATQQAALKVTTARKQSFGIELSRRPWAASSAEMASSEQEGIAGGALGLIVDARGRPIELPDDITTRQARMSEWLTAVSAYDATVFSSLD
jgi:hypothetical protein